MLSAGSEAVVHDNELGQQVDLREWSSQHLAGFACGVDNDAELKAFTVRVQFRSVESTKVPVKQAVGVGNCLWSELLASGVYRPKNDSQQQLLGAVKV